MLPQIDTVASSSPYKGTEIATSLMTVPRIITAIKLNKIDFGIGDKNLGDTALSYKSFYIFSTIKQSILGLFSYSQHSTDLLC